MHGGSVEEGEDLCFDGVIDFDHVDGSTGLSRFSQDDKGLAREWVCHPFGVKSRYHSDRIAPAKYCSALVLYWYCSFSVLWAPYSE